MNYRLIAKLLGILVLLMGFFMLFSLIWADPDVGFHTHPQLQDSRLETEGIWGLLYSSLICWIFGGLLYHYGRNSQPKIFRRDAMAVVGLSWVLATVLGALPYLFSGTARGPSLRVLEESREVLVVSSPWEFWSSWDRVTDISDQQFLVIDAVANASARGITQSHLERLTGLEQATSIFRELKQHPQIGIWLIGPGEDLRSPANRASHYRIEWVKMGVFDAMFESQSGFSTTGATVICDLEDPYLVPHCILFWRSSTHFLGGLGIIVLFVVLLGQGSAGKALMRAEMPGPTFESSNARMQHTAWMFAAMYTGLNVVLAIILVWSGMSAFDAICHSFGTMATGGFSTYNASLGHFSATGSNGLLIEYVVIIFMIFAGANFSLLFLVLIGKPVQLFRDLEFRTYVAVMGIVTVAIIGFGWYAGDADFSTWETAFRNGLFQVVSIMTTTGFGTANFDNWNEVGRALLLLLMFVGGCAGSTGGGMKVIRHVLFYKIMRIEVEHAFHPKEVQLLKLGGKPTEDQTLRHSILVYFGLVTSLFIFGFAFVVMFESNLTWDDDVSNKLLDSASAVAATLNNIGPGLGVVGATENYANFSCISKALFIWLMMLGRLEVLPILVLFSPRFWRDQ